MDGYEIVIKDFMQDISGVLPNSVCNSVPLLGYDGMTPGPLIIGRTGVQDVTRFTNAINPESKFFPPAGPGDRGGEGASRPLLSVIVISEHVHAAVSAVYLTAAEVQTPMMYK